MLDDPAQVGALSVALPGVIAIWIFFNKAHWGVRAIGYVGLFIAVGYLRATGGLFDIGELVLSLTGSGGSVDGAAAPAAR